MKCGRCDIWREETEHRPSSTKEEGNLRGKGKLKNKTSTLSYPHNRSISSTHFLWMNPCSRGHPTSRWKINLCQWHQLNHSLSFSLIFFSSFLHLHQFLSSALFFSSFSSFPVLCRFSVFCACIAGHWLCSYDYASSCGARSGDHLRNRGSTSLFPIVRCILHHCFMLNVRCISAVLLAGDVWNIRNFCNVRLQNTAVHAWIER